MSNRQEPEFVNDVELKPCFCCKECHVNALNRVKEIPTITLGEITYNVCCSVKHWFILGIQVRRCHNQ